MISRPHVCLAARAPLVLVGVLELGRGPSVPERERRRDGRIEWENGKWDREDREDWESMAMSRMREETMAAESGSTAGMGSVVCEGEVKLGVARVLSRVRSESV